MVKRALVTGATGGLGQALCQALIAEGYMVRATGRSTSIGALIKQMGCEFIIVDFAAKIPKDLTDDIDIVFHLAALSKPWGPKAIFDQVNVKATQILLKNAKKSGCERFVYASTPSIFSESYDRIKLTEKSSISSSFANAYARTKYEAEQFVLGSNDTFFSTAALRPRAIIGPNDNVLLPRLLRAAKRGYLPLPNGGKALIDLSDVRDVAAAFIAIDQNMAGAAGKAFHISNGQAISLRELFDLIFQNSKNSPRYISIRPIVLTILASILEAICRLIPHQPEPILTKYTANTLSYSQTLDISFAKRVLKWSPQYNAQQAIRNALKGKAI